MRIHLPPDLTFNLLHMALILILLFIVVAAVIYEQYFYENPDKLDGNGNATPSKKKKKSYR